MSQNQARSISFALRRLRYGVLTCCWLIGLALFIQVCIWSLATYTDLRYDRIQATPVEVEALVVTGRDKRQVAVAPSVHNELGLGEQPPDPNRVLGRNDLLFDDAMTMVGAVGTLAMGALVALLGLGVMLAAASPTPGIDKTVSAFMWALILAILVLPLGRSMDLPWPEGALNSYASMSAAIDATEAGEASASAEFFARFLLMPLACLVGTALVAIRFGGGLEAAILPREAILDPVLEAEASGIQASSNASGGRTAGAFKRMVASSPSEDDMPDADKVPDPVVPMPSATAVSAGSPQRRPI